METNNKKVCCNVIGVDCVPNDSINIQNGGPDYLGFDFNISRDDTEELIKFISVALFEAGIPLIDIYNYGEIKVDEKEICTKEKILAAIAKDAEFLKTEAQRHRSVPVRRAIM